MNAHDKTWEEWQRRTGELPPDFDAMPSEPWLPDALKGVASPAAWPACREVLKRDVQHCMFGRYPPKPENLRAVVTNERR